MNLKRTISSLLLLVLTVSCCVASPFESNQVYAADVKGALTLNSQFSVNVEAGGDYLYSMNITETGVLAISGDFDSHSAGWIKIIDSNGKIIATDEKSGKKIILQEKIIYH